MAITTDRPSLIHRRRNRLLQMSMVESPPRSVGYDAPANISSQNDSSAARISALKISWT